MARRIRTIDTSKHHDPPTPTKTVVIKPDAPPLTITGEDAARVAGMVLSNCKGVPDDYHVVTIRGDELMAIMQLLNQFGRGDGITHYQCRAHELRILAGSALGQR